MAHTPTQRDCCWLKTTLNCIRDGGIWCAPSAGVFIVDQLNKRLLFTERSPMFEQECWDWIIGTGTAIEWRVEDKTGGDKPKKK